MTYNEKVSAAIAYTSVYEKRVGKILRAEERNAMELHVADNPEIRPGRSRYRRGSKSAVGPPRKGKTARCE